MSLREELAALEHFQWALWTKWQMQEDSPEARARWQRQIDTTYEDLSEKEKDSDRLWADKALDVIQKYADAHPPTKVSLLDVSHGLGRYPSFEGQPRRCMDCGALQFTPHHICCDRLGAEEAP